MRAKHAVIALVLPPRAANRGIAVRQDPGVRNPSRAGANSGAEVVREPSPRDIPQLDER